MKNLKFHTGRGGGNYRPGFVTFVDFENIDEGNTFEYFVYYEELEKWFTPSGNELDCQINEDGTGYVNYDYEFDTTEVVREDNLSSTQIYSLIRSKDILYFKDEINRILNEYYKEYIDENI